MSFRKSCLGGAAIAAFLMMGWATMVSAEQVTYTKDVAPIFNKNCVECHRAGEAVPITLTSYKEARPWVKSIKRMVQTRTMPPWHADPKIGHWKNERRLAKKDIDTIVAWANTGAPEGNPADLPPSPEFTKGWKIGEPDLIFTMVRDEILSAELEDEYRYVMIPTGLKQERWLKAAEVRPGNMDVVHHVITFVTTMEAMGSGEGLGGALSSFLGGYAPGMQPFVMAEGEGMRLPANSILVLQMHYHKETGEAATDRTSIGIQFADYPVMKEKLIGSVSNERFRIPPGAGNHRVDAAYTVTEDITMQEIMPHMHLRGKDMKVWAKFPDGETRDLLLVPKYDFNWQFFYEFEEPLRLPKGTKLFARAHFDNSKNNPFNPDPAKAVTFGLPTTDEMMFAFYLYTKDAENMNVRDVGDVVGGGAGGR